MDYTTVENVKAAMRVSVDTDDALIASLITQASRALDRRCTGEADESAHNYFMLEDKIDNLFGNINRDGIITCIPHKPVVHSVTAFSYRENVTKSWSTVATDRCEIVGNRVIAYPLNLSLDFPARCRVQISYNGGFSGSASGLPADLVELTTLLTARYYREYEGGLSDVIGVPELGNQMIYTKAWPQRLVDQLDTFIRREGWNYPS